MVVGGGGAGSARGDRRGRKRSAPAHRARLQGRADAQPHGRRRGRLGRRHPRRTTASTTTSTIRSAAATGSATRTWSSTSSPTAPRRWSQLEHWGCPWSRKDDGHVNVRFFGGMKVQRTWFAADKTGFHMLHTLFQTSLKYPSIKRYDEFFCADLIVEDGRVQGVVAIDIATGEFFLFECKAAIICTGGAGRVFGQNTNAGIVTGDGMGIAFRHGVPLRDMEFVQYHPTALPGSGRADHRRLPRRRRDTHQQGRLSLPPGLRPRARPTRGRGRRRWSSAPATACRRRSGTRSRKGRTVEHAASATRSGSTCAISAPRRSTSACR